jgi:predicted MFS family arabinose efflux permease
MRVLSVIRHHFWEDHQVVQLYFLTFLLMGVNAAAFMVFVPLFLPTIGYTDLDGVAFALGVPTAVALLSQNIWGYLCLKSDKFKLYVLMSIISFIFLFGILSYVKSVWVIFIYLFFYGFVYTAIFPSAQTAISLLSHERKAEVLGKLVAYESVGWGVCSLLNGELITWFGGTVQTYRYLFLFYLVINIAAFFYFYTKFPSKIEDLNLDEMERVSFKGYYRVLSDRRIIALFTGFLLVAAGSTFFFNYFSRYMNEILNGTERQIGISLALATAFGALAFPVLGRFVDKRGAIFTLFIGVLLYILDFGILIGVKNPWVFAIIYSAPLYPFMSVSTNSYIAKETCEQDRGIGFGLVNTVFQIAGVLAPLLGYYLFKTYTLEKLPLFSTMIVCTALLPFMVLACQRKRNEKELQSQS